jgi:hypothetical protein
MGGGSARAAAFAFGAHHEAQAGDLHARDAAGPDQQSVAVGAWLLALLAFAWDNLFRRDAWPKQWW